MRIESFADELLNRRAPLVKVAKKGNLLLRGLGWGSLIGGGAHTGKLINAQVSGNPHDLPEGRFRDSVGKGALAGMTAATALSMLARLGSKGKVH